MTSLRTEKRRRRRRNGRSGLLWLRRDHHLLLSTLLILDGAEREREGEREEKFLNPRYFCPGGGRGGEEKRETTMPDELNILGVRKQQRVHFRTLSDSRIHQRERAAFTYYTHTRPRAITGNCSIYLWKIRRTNNQHETARKKRPRVYHCTYTTSALAAAIIHLLSFLLTCGSPQCSLSLLSLSEGAQGGQRVVM